MARFIDLEKIKPIDFPSVDMDGLDVVRYLATLPTVDAVEVAWIPVSERLPEEKECVLIWTGRLHVARIAKGISEETRAAMKRGELPDPDVVCWCASEGYKKHKRSSLYSFGDIHGNNTVPYAWHSNVGPMQWNGQEVTHWMPLPEAPKEEK